MSPRRHVDDLFSAAYENDLSPIDEARFHSHLQSCAPCATAFAEFTASVEALRELPPARMPHAIHLPSTPPVAERTARGRFNLSGLKLGLLRRFPATAAAGAIAAVLVIVALTHGTGTGTPIAALNTPATEGSAAHAPEPAVQTASCAQQFVRVTGSSPPAGFSALQEISVPSRPGVRLVLATSSLDVAAGQAVDVYAQLVVPVSSAAAPGAASGAGSTLAFRPCVAIGVEGTSVGLVPASYGSSVPVAVPGSANGDIASPAAAGEPGGSDAVITFDIPAGLAPGTKLHLTATVPAGYGGDGTPELTATLTLTTR